MQKQAIKKRLQPNFQDNGIKMCLGPGRIMIFLFLLINISFFLPCRAEADLHVKDGLLLDGYDTPFVMRGYAFTRLKIYSFPNCQIL